MAQRNRSTRTTAALLGVLAGVALAATACSAGSSTAGARAASTGPSSGSSSSGSSSTSGVTAVTRSTSLGTVLTTASGMTLYHRTDESADKIECLSGCVASWPPYTVPAGATPEGVSGLGTTTRPDGTTQVTYDGEPLYTYAGDSSPGQTNGNGVGGIWYAVTVPGTGGSGRSNDGSGY